MPRAIWKGSINFGLVNIPVALHSAEARDEISFNQLDQRNFARVRYQRVNEKTGKEVPWSEIVKGYEYEEGQYVVLTDEDFRRANVEATQMVEIVSFVDPAEVSPIYYDKPYYLEPLKKAHKSYALLREVLKRSKKMGIGKIVIRSKQYLAAVIASGPALIVNLLRYAHELHKIEKLELPAQNLKELEIGEKEIKLAERLVEAMIEPWRAEKYQDSYREDLLALIEKKVKTGKTKTIEPVEKEEGEPPKRQARILDMMELLKRSVEQTQKRGPEKARKPAERWRKAVNE